jgi:hypothetical protein
MNAANIVFDQFRYFEIDCCIINDFIVNVGLWQGGKDFIRGTISLLLCKPHKDVFAIEE